MSELSDVETRKARGRMRRMAVGAVLAAVTFVVTCVVVRGFFPYPEITGIREKLVHFWEHGNEFDTLFLGSSRINYQVIPAQFDELMAAAGKPTKTYNGGVGGMRPPEDVYFLEKLLKAKPRNLRWVFIELNHTRPRLEEDVRGTARAQYWHDGARMWLLWRRAIALKPAKKKRTLAKIWEEVREPLSEIPGHLQLFIHEMTNMGKGDVLTQYLLERPHDWRTTMTDVLGRDLRGWIPARPKEVTMTPSNRAIFEAQRAERLVKPARRDLDDSVSQEVLESMIAMVEKLGATPVLLAAPVTANRIFYPRPERQAKTLVLDFNDLTRYPELYENKYRLDTEHLNAAGAKVFTRLLAERWLEERKARGER